MMKLSLLAAASAALVVSANAIDTRGAPLSSAQIFQNIDTNNNGFIEIAEAKKYMLNQGASPSDIDGIIRDLWSEDHNKDGAISWEEWAAMSESETGTNNNNTNTNSAAAAAAAATHHPNTSPSSASAGVAVNTFSRFAASAPSMIVDIDEDEEEVDDYDWIDFAEDVGSKFCPTQELADDDSCWHKVYYSESEDYYYACVEDDETNELICYTINLE